MGPNGVPKARPIVGASKGLTTALRELIDDILEPVAKTEPDPREAQSMEELVRSVFEANSNMEQKAVKQCLVGSMNVEQM